ncbi:MAG: hypothetical protein P4L51_28575 [Puia sp.]|nr:hypothetical protein [Puia sp.]
MTQNTPVIYHAPEKKIKILSTGRITNNYLIKYVVERRIHILVARQYCVEANYCFEIEGQPDPSAKIYYAIGFRNNAGGYELRSRFFKGSSAPKTFTFLDNGSRVVVVVEGFFELLTFISFQGWPSKDLPNFLVLNSTSLFTAALEPLKRHDRVISLLNNDAAGDFCTEMGLEEIPGYEDCRFFFKGYNDLNSWATEFGLAVFPSFEKGGSSRLSGGGS